ncbi:TetR/AcrR family transcriptional regulator [Novosphingobium rosa]|uniref:TetR/AcrR family transcriptional regulator n=1 Tax=Novosphingobium rosa TaxID=76978 RepID=UPI000B1256D7|nr:TetR/AcrR family transcriptional regulator [Novosphingobium rosa]
MPQIRKVEDDVLLERLARTFKDVGYEGASLSAISEETGLKKSSLYHRFPRGKEQMAQEVLQQVAQALDTHLFPILAGDGTPERKMAAFVRVMDGVYASGRESCLLNMLSPPRGAQGVCGAAIASTFHRLLAALKDVACQAGASEEQAALRAEEVLIALQGALVLARGIGDPGVFERMLARLPGIIDPQDQKHDL